MYEDEELTFKEFIKKKSVIVLIVTMFICIGFNAFRLTRRGLFLDSSVFVVERSNECYKGGKYEVQIDKQRDCTKYKLICGKQKKDVSLYWDGDKATVVFADGNKISGYFEDGELVDEDGKESDYVDYDPIIDEGDEVQDFPIDEGNIANFVCKEYIGYKEIYGQNRDIFLLFDALVVFVVGLLGFYFPNKYYFRMKRWLYKNAELSEDGVFVVKLIGVFGIIVSYVCVMIIGM